METSIFHFDFSFADAKLNRRTLLSVFSKIVVIITKKLEINIE
jgi:hypothetical protein